MSTLPQIKPQCVVSLTWTLRDAQGEVLDVLDEPIEFLVGGEDLLPSIEQALQELSPGANLDLRLEPQQAFGDYDEMLVFLEPRALFPPGLQEGMTIEGSALPNGCSPEARVDTLYTITELYPEHVVLDGNHPLAGLALHLSLQVHAVREASVEEVGLGSAGPGFFRVQAAQKSLQSNDTLH